MIWLLALAHAETALPMPSVQIAVQGMDPSHTAAVEQAVTAVRLELWRCYSVGRMETPELEGTVVAVREDVAWHLATPSAAAGVDACVVRRLEEAQVPGGDAMVTLTLAMAVPPASRTELTQVTGDDAVAELVASTLVRQRYCYEHVLLNEAVSPGAVVFELRVDDLGWGRAQLVQGELPPDLFGCMKRALETQRYAWVPATVQITYTLEILP